MSSFIVLKKETVDWYVVSMPELLTLFCIERRIVFLGMVCSILVTESAPYFVIKTSFTYS